MCLVMLCCSHFASFPQGSFKGSQVYFELAGGGSGLTLNIEHLIVSTDRWHIGGRFGAGAMMVNGFRKSGFPVSIHFFNRSGRHHLETGIGLSYIEGVWSDELYGHKVWNKGLYAIPMIGYRFQKPGGGLLFKVLWTPLLQLREYGKDRITKSSDQVPHWIGVSAGYYIARRSH